MNESSTSVPDSRVAASIVPSVTNTHQVRTNKRIACCPVVLAWLAALVISAPATATIYSVGSGADCTHTTFSTALAAAVADASPGEHTVRIARSDILLADVDYSIINPAQNIRIIGGVPNCSTSVPAAGARTVLRRAPGTTRRVLEVSNSSANPRRTITLDRLTLQDGNLTSGFGGGLAVIGRVNVDLFGDTRIQDNRAPNGGGVGLAVLSLDPDVAPRLLVTSGSRICNNTADGAGSNGLGGGVWMLGASDLQLWNGRICDNEARRDGGGVYMTGAGNRIRLDPWLEEVVEISGNRAGMSEAFATDRGFGGGIYAGPHSSISYASNLTSPTRFSLVINANEANFGGALFAQGDTDPAQPFTLHDLRNVALIGNDARGSGGAVELRNAVDLMVAKHGAGQCQFFGPTPCVWAVSNRALNTGESTVWGAGGFARLSHEPGAPRPALRVAGALFLGNEDVNGTAAVIDARGNSAVRILRSVFSDNSAGGSETFRALIEANTEYLFAYNTVLDNSVTRLLWAANGEVNATGSILYAPGITPFVNGGGASLVHNGCLLSHTSTGLPAGVTVAAPALGSGYMPTISSPAIDRCGTGVADNFWPAGLDAYGLPAPVDIPSVPNTGGAWDLGAVEHRPDVIFSDGFEGPPI